MKERLRDTGAVNYDFGWENFIAASRESKRNYLTITLYDNLVQLGYPDDIAKLVARSWCTDVPEKGYIDHQSVYGLPIIVKEYEDNYEIINKDFFDDFSKYILQEDLAILGGNDNEDENDPVWEIPIASKGNIPLPKGLYHKHDFFIARKDGDFWVLFNKKSGHKIRLSFITNQPYEKSSLPELVDLKITNQCNYNCPWCYANSTPNGKHADNIQVLNILRALQILKVFEVSFGGGNIVSHPEINYRLHDANDFGLSTSITVRSIEDLNQIHKISKLSGIAISFNGVEDFEEIGDVQKSIDKTIWINVIMGSISRTTFGDILRDAEKNNLGLILLGYKSTGRGINFTPVDYSWWLEEVQKSKGYKKIGIDTALAKEFEKELKNAGVDRRLYYTEEGKFSMFIDAVEGFVAKSSYDGEKFPINMRSYPGDLAEQIKEIYGRF